MTEVLKPSEEVAVHDMMKIGSRVHRVVGFRPYPGFYKVCPGKTARIAVYDSGVEMTLVDGGMSRVLATAA